MPMNKNQNVLLKIFAKIIKKYILIVCSKNEIMLKSYVENSHITYGTMVTAYLLIVMEVKP